MKTTTEHLVADIVAIIPEPEQSQQLRNLLQCARNFDFHDYKSRTTHPAPKIDLVDRIVEIGDPRLIPIMRAVMEGQYDESPDETDMAAMRKEWTENGGTAEGWDSIFLSKDVKNEQP